jgi:hypothetical protein
MSFSEIEEVLGFSLPLSARSYQAWWGNNLTYGRHSAAWLLAGWETEQLDLAGERVTFRRAAQGRAQVLKAKARSKAAPHSKTEKSRPVDLKTLGTVFGDPVRLSLAMRWRSLGPVHVGSGNKLVFPAVPSVPGLYRFRLSGQGADAHYIGETADLRRRFYHYRNPGPSQRTNIRINGLLLDHLAAGGSVEADIIAGEVALTIGDESAPVDLALKPVRRLLEHAAIVAQGGTDISSLNR